MKRDITKAVVFLSLLVTLLLGVAWYNNVMMAVRWNPADGHGKEYFGPITWLNWSAVDFSTATTLIPFFGMLLITAGFFRITNAKRGTDTSEHFPFFRSYTSVTVAIGLIGTVWGLIMIGYYDADKVKMADLVLCLKTALFSTLIALIWVFLVTLPAEYIMQWWYRKVTGYRERSAVDFLKGMKETTHQLTENMEDAKTTFGELNKGLLPVRDSISGIADAMDRFKKTSEGVLSDAAQTLKSVNANLSEQQKVAKEQQLAAQQQAQVVERIAGRVKQLTSRIKDLEQEKRDAENRAGDAEGKLAKVKETVG